MNIIYKLMKEEEIHDEIFFGFDRHQETKKIKYIDNRVIKEKAEHFFNDWSDKKLTEVAREAKNVVAKGGVLLLACIDDLVVGFCTLENKIFFDEYINLGVMHVSNKHRRLGIGNKLFQLIQVYAKKLGATKLYISSHPDIESQKFYKRMNCSLAKMINQELYDLEPNDIHLEKIL